MSGLLDLAIQHDEAFDMVHNRWIVACTFSTGEQPEWWAAYGHGRTVFEARGDAVENLGNLLRKIEYDRN